MTQAERGLFETITDGMNLDIRHRNTALLKKRCDEIEQRLAEVENAILFKNNAAKVLLEDLETRAKLRGDVCEDGSIELDLGHSTVATFFKAFPELDVAIDSELTAPMPEKKYE